MATIELCYSKANKMSGLFDAVKKSVSDYQSDLVKLNKKALKVDNSVCDMTGIISAVQSSTQTQEDKACFIDKVKEANEQFLSDVVSVDDKVSDVVTKNKNDFYEQYNYLKPECEKSGWEKFKDGCKKAVDWCKEHWVAVVTVAVVVVAACIAAVCGIAIAFIAAIAGIVALATCIADVVCMFVTGGKSIAMVLEEHGFHVLADIFQGISIGANIVSIVFPVGAVIKSMAKIGVKAFAKASFTAMKVSMKEAFKKVFKSGFKEGVKNFFKITFKTLVFDIDDLKTIREPSLSALKNNNWTVSDDGLSLIPTNGSNKPKRFNPDGLTYDEILQKFDLDAIPLKKNGEVDWGKIQVDSVNIKNMNQTRGSNKYGLKADTNFGQANLKLQEKGLSLKDFEKDLGIKITWHEDLNLKTMRMIPSEIHGNINHAGGVANYGFHLDLAPSRSNDVISNILQRIQRGIFSNTAQAAY